MKSHSIRSIATLALVSSLASCTHITMLGHTSAYDINAEFSGDPISPLNLNAGFEGRSFAAVPPRKAVKWWENLNPEKLPEGDVMSSILELKIEKVTSSGYASGVPFDYVTSGATGLAADAAAGSSPTGNLKTNSPQGVVPQGTAAGPAPNPAKIAEKIRTITASGPDTFGS